MKQRSPSLAGAVAASLLVLAGACWWPATASAQGMPKVVRKVPPEFPESAIRRGVDKAVLKLRLSVDGTGKPTTVEVVEVTPAKGSLLNDAVIEALNKWRFEGSGKPTQFEMQLVLTSD